MTWLSSTMKAGTPSMAQALATGASEILMTATPMTRPWSRIGLAR